MLRDGLIAFVRKGGHAIDDVIGQAKTLLLQKRAAPAGACRASSTSRTTRRTATSSAATSATTSSSRGRGR